MANRNVTKGEVFDLNGMELNKLQIRLVWKGHDVDLSAFLLGSNRELIRNEDFVHFNSLKRECTYQEYKQIIKQQGRLHKNTQIRKNPTAITWMMDARPMSHDGSVLGAQSDLCGTDKNSAIDVSIDAVRPDIHEILLVVSLYNVSVSSLSEPITFSDIEQLSLVLISGKEQEEILRYKVEERFKHETVVEVARLARGKAGRWVFNAVCEGYNGDLRSFADLYI